MNDEQLEKDRGDMLIEGERAGVASNDGDGEGEAESVGEPFAEGTKSGIEEAMLRMETDLRVARRWLVLFNSLP